MYVSSVVAEIFETSFLTGSITHDLGPLIVGSAGEICQDKRALDVFMSDDLKSPIDEPKSRSKNMVSTLLLPLALLALLSFSRYSCAIRGADGISKALSFSNTDPKFEFKSNEMDSVVSSLANVFTWEEGKDFIIKEPLPIESYMAYTDNNKQPMFPVRMAKVMKYLLEDMDTKAHPTDKQHNLHLLYLFSGLTPDMVMKKASNLLGPENAEAFKTLRASTGDYDEMCRLLREMKVRLVPLHEILGMSALLGKKK
ncbi:hypothetical protein PCANC_04676 [Puccinia coronata f. sp. avenae]|uniref:Uncharacterized protein n=1 Tax=Puccinia coronata f. sp. avenae TaxID=200324 RepID=A0A2N5V0H6_9BASI|nr:hypothetical protein PCASD_06791 [Puccinia coronata f. sp. avenae]PLW56096.1 hypothetical protein PCANC_04676 [Puccinia coronata f. sp. avenae]